MGVMLWMPPLLLSSGGVPGYLAALSRQGTDDFSGVQMLATQPSWSLFKTALARTFQVPWQHPLLTWAVLAFAALGLARMARRSRRALWLIALAFGPYLLFHLSFQESETIRYGLPLLVPVCGLAAFGLHALGTRTLAAGSAVLVCASLIVAVPPLQGYAADGAPIFRIFQDLEARTANAAGGPVTLGMHHRVASEARQAIVWAREAWAFELLETEPGLEVGAMTDHFLSGGGPVWFLADPLRRDLDAIDPRGRKHDSLARWPAVTRALIPFSRPSDVDAWLVRPPTWMLGSGWALTPEMAGITALRRLGPHRRPAEAFIRRGPEPLRMLIGGRHLGKDDGPASIAVTLDGQEIARWPVVAHRRFEEWLELPSGVPAGVGAYATLGVAVRTESGRPPPVGLEYFDAASVTDVMWTYSDGWHEPELEPRTGRVWRWMGPRGVIRVQGGPAALTVRVEGESPMRNFDAGSELVVRADGVEVGRVTLTADFSEVFVVPESDHAQDGGAQTRLITIDTSQVMVPAERGDSADRRELGLRVYRVTLSPNR
jgi:hypothetical protein